MFPLLDQLFNDPLGFLQEALFRVPAILIALIAHEVAHGYVAYRLGDPTAKVMGRLTLNPLKHLDPLGTIMMFFLGFGWAKPVPVDPRHFKKPRRDDFLVSIAGITMNLILYIVFFAIYYILYINMLPIVRAGDFWLTVMPYVMEILVYILQINLFFAIFNLLPVPPLDGSHVFGSLLNLIGNGLVRFMTPRWPEKANKLATWLVNRGLFASRRTSQIGMALLLVLSFSGWLGKGLSFVSGAIIDGTLRLFGMIFGG